MQCPVCKKPMIILEFQDIELDYCTRCHGCWLDRGELEFLLASDTQLLDLEHIRQSEKGDRKCPRCRKRMRVQLFPGTSVEIDACPSDGGIWLDGGELQSIAKSQSDEDAVKRITQFFSDKFDNQSKEE